MLAFWILATVLAKWLAPSWDSIAFDGDFQYLPPERGSVVAQALLEDAFPEELSRSQIVLVVSRDSRNPIDAEDVAHAPNETSESSQTARNHLRAKLSKADERVALDLLRRILHRHAEAQIHRAIKAGWDTKTPPSSPTQKRWLEEALASLDEAIVADDEYCNYFANRFAEVGSADEVTTKYWPRLAIAYWDRGYLRRLLGDASGAEADISAAVTVYPKVAEAVPAFIERDVQAWDSLLQVLSWHDKTIGGQFRKEYASLILLRLESELAAVSNIALLNALEATIEEVREQNQLFIEPGLQILPTGAAAIGAETLRSSADAIRYTELFTVVLVLLILAVIYRSPLLIAVPLISLAVASICATGFVATLASLGSTSGFDWIDLKIFTTSRIFVFVILFGAGTDYCLFLISRVREEAVTQPWNKAVEKSLTRVASALLGSALTTVVGLAMLWFADFGKFHYSGPVIAICLLIALAVCTTLTPALLIAFGHRVLWPARLPTRAGEAQSPLWFAIGTTMTRRPLVVMCLGLLILVPPAIYGLIEEGKVTYDLSSELSPSTVSRRGMGVLRRNMRVGETTPIQLLMVRKDATTHEQMEKDLPDLVRTLIAIPGVSAVRHAGDPLGENPPDEANASLAGGLLRLQALKSHRISQRYFWSSVDAFSNRLARLDIVTAGESFAIESVHHLQEIEKTLEAITTDPTSPWFESTYALAGAIPSLVDLRETTTADATRIQTYVVLAVLVILILVLRRWILSVYMIFTVLITYYATLGISVVFFRWIYADTYVGLDWKVPIFLFVILVAVGQDYNVYLVTRILEEQKSSHPLAAIRRAVAKTGGIITSCGVVMAGTFFSMTASAWVPQVSQWLGYAGATPVGTLRGVTELGFALGFGVLLDTFYVRTVLVPAFTAWWSGMSGFQPNLTGPQTAGKDVGNDA